ncbi:phosphonoacetaldehyde hydrolase [Cohaesibacter sp. ES.047]|uniref:phosphonoacetaldehyde hydrolase n=1 Tax=Cohaesibacter sp. ES.047 TaxID=1798205 RepID=UPI000BB9B2ED|nr:phosphonoacetaldehyde hydrolase [Cohaesibacter sp. ES.047]SNY92641.1 phosphonoacetaldehyde hydrolase [Cohaesibacter sp. ES.047]
MKAIKAVVFDWAGTMVDFGSFAPMGVFVKCFEEFGVTATIDQARAPMGLPKWDHINAMMKDADIAAQWQTKHGAAPTDADVDRVYKIFVPMNEKVAADYAELIPGALEAVRYLRARNIKIGSTTGYVRSIMEQVLPVAAAQGYVPDNLICADDLSEGRPGPLGMYQTFVDLAVYPPSAVIKVDDTVPGLLEGSAAGCLTVGLALSGNFVGKTRDELASMPEEDVERLRARASEMLKDGGADYVIDTVADLPALLERI